MDIILFVDNQVPKSNVLIQSIKTPCYLDFDYKKIDYSNVNRVGFLWQNSYEQMPFGTTTSSYRYFTDEFAQFVSLVAVKPITIDLITCNFTNAISVNEIKSICEKYPNLTLNYSIDQTGNLNNSTMSNWIMESSGEDIKQLYFNSNIDNYDIVLDTTFLYYNTTNSLTTSIDFVKGNTLTQFDTGFTDISEFDISGTTYTITNTDVIELPFEFPLNDISYSYFGVGLHGPILLSNNPASSATGDYPNDTNTFPSGTNIIPLWTRFVQEGTKTYFVPNSLDYLIIQYSNIKTRGVLAQNTSNLFSIQVKLNSNGVIEMKYKNLQNAGITELNSTIFITGVFANNLYYTLNTTTNSFDRKLNNLDLSGSYFNASNLNKLTNYTFDALVGSDFSNFDFSGLNLNSINFTDCNLTNVNLTNTTLNNAILTNTDLSNTIISNTSFFKISGTPSTLPSLSYRLEQNNIFGPKVKYISNNDLSNCDLSNTDLSGSVLTANFTRSNFTNSNFTNADISASNFTESDFTNSNFTNMKLHNSNLTGATLTNVYGKLSDCSNNTLPSEYVFVNKYIVGPGVNLQYADLSGMNLSNINLSGADLSGATLTGVRGQLTNTSNAQLSPEFRFANNYIIGPGVNLQSADLSGVDLTGANLTGADLSGANLIGVSGKLNNTTNTILPSGYYFRNNYIVGPGVNLHSAYLYEVDLTGINISNAILTDAILTGVSGQLFNANGSVMPNGYNHVNNYIIGPSVKLIGADLSNVNFFDLNVLNISKSDLSGANLSNSNFSGVNASNSIFSNTNLTQISGQFSNVDGIDTLPTGYAFFNRYIVGANLSLEDADLSFNDLSNMNLSGTQFISANLSFNDLTNVNLSGSDLTNANLTNTNLTNANISNANLTNVNFTGVSGQLSNVGGAALSSDYTFANNHIAGPGVDLTGVDLSGADLSGYSLVDVNLTQVRGQVLTNPSALPSGYVMSNRYVIGPNVNLQYANLTGVNLSGCDLSGSDLSGANLTLVSGQIANKTNTILPIGYQFKNNYIVGPNVDLSNADLSGVDLTGVNLSGAKLTNANLSGVDLTGVNLSGVNLNNANLFRVSGQLGNYSGAALPSGYQFLNNYIVGRNVDLSGVDLSGAQLGGTILSGVQLNNANLSRANLGTANLGSANFSGANLSSANLSNSAIFSSANFSGADLSGANFSNSLFSSANFSGANLFNVVLTSANFIYGVNLSNATLTGVWGRPSNLTNNTTLPSGYGAANGYIVGPDVNLYNADLSGADLSGFSLSSANLTQVRGRVLTPPSALPSGYVMKNRYIVGPNVNLTNADLSGVDLSGINLSQSILTNAVLSNVSGQLSDISGTTLSAAYKFANRYIVGPYVNLSNVDLSGFDLSGYSLYGANLSQVRGRLQTEPTAHSDNYVIKNNFFVGPNVNLSNADLTDANLSGVDLSGTDLSGAVLNGVNGQVANSTNTILATGYKFCNNYIVGPNVDLTGVNFFDVDLSGVNFSGVNAFGTDLSGANLYAVSGQFADVSNTILAPGYQFFNKYIIGPNINLSGADLSEANLTGVNLFGSNLEDAILYEVQGQLADVSGATLSSTYAFVNRYIIGPDVNLTGADLSNCDLSNANLNSVNFTQANLSYSNFSNANISQSDLSNVNLTGIYGQLSDVDNVVNLPSDYKFCNNYFVGPNVNLTNADLSGVDFTNVNLSGSDLSNVTLTNVYGQLSDVSGVVNLPSEYKFLNNYFVGPNVNLIRTDLSNSDLSNSNLSKVNFTQANLSYSNFTQTNISYSDLSNVTLTGIYGQLSNSDEVVNLPSAYSFVNRYIIGPNVNLTGADLSNCDLSNANLSGVNFTQANLSNSNFTQTNISYSDLSNVTLTNVYGQLSDVSGVVNLSSEYKFHNNYIIGPDVNLTNADLSNCDFTNVNLSGSDLSNVTLTNVYGQLSDVSGVVNLPSEYKFLNNYFVGPNVNLTNADLSNCDLSNANLSGVNFTQANLSYGNLTQTNISYSDLSNVTLTGIYGQLSDVTGVVNLPSEYKFANRYFVGPGVNLTNANLVGVDLSNANLSGVNFTQANLSYVNLTATNISYSDLSNVNLTGIYGQLSDVSDVVNLPSAYAFVNRYIIGAGVNLTGADLSNCDLSNANLSGVIFTQANLSYSDLTNSNISFSDLTGVNLTGVYGQLSDVDYVALPDGYEFRNNYIIGPNVNLTGADLSGQNLSGINLNGANLIGANLYGIAGQLVDVSNATLSPEYQFFNNYIIGPDVNLTGADLTGADFTNVNLSGSNLSNATLTGVRGHLSNVDNVTLPEGYTFRNNYVVGPGVNLSGVDLTLVDLSNVNLVEVDLSGADLSGANLIGVSGQIANTNYANLSSDYMFVNNYIVGPYVNLMGANLSSSNVTGANLTQVNLLDASLIGVYGQVSNTNGATLPTGYQFFNNYIVGPGVNLSFGDISSSNLAGFILSNSNFTQTNLSHVNFSNANISQSDLSNAVLIGAHGQLSDVSGVINLPAEYEFRNNYIVGPGVNLISADLSGVNFTQINLTGADLTDANLTGVSGQLNNQTDNVTTPNGYVLRNYYFVGPNVNLIGSDLSNCDLTNLNLSNSDLSGCILTNSDLSNSDLSGVNLTAANLFGVHGKISNILRTILPTEYKFANNYIIGPGVNLSNADLSNSDLSGVDLSGADLSGAVLSGVSGQLSNVLNCKLSPSYMFANNYIVGPNVNLSYVDLSGADLSGYSLVGANLTQVKGQVMSDPLALPTGYEMRNRFIVGPNVNLSNADLTNSDLSGIDLSGTDLSGAVLSGVSGQLSNVLNCKLSPYYMFANNYIVGPNVNLSGVDLSGFNLNGFSLDGANLTQVKGQVMSDPLALPDNYEMRNRYIVGPNVNLSNADLTNMDLTEIDLSGTDLSGAVLSGVSGQLSNVNNCRLAIAYKFENRYIIGPNVNLSYVDLSGADLSGYSLDGANLTQVKGQVMSDPLALPDNYEMKNRFIVGPNVNLSNADLTDMDLSGINLSAADLSGTVLSGVRGKLSEANNIVLSAEYLVQNLYLVGPNVNLSNVDLSGADLSGYSLDGANLTQVKGQLLSDPLALPTSYVMRNRFIVGPNVNLSNANLTNVNLAEIDLSGTDLSGAVLSGVSGQLSNVNNCRLAIAYKFENRYIIGPNVNLSYVDLSGFDLSGYSLVGANLTQVKGQVMSDPLALPTSYVMRNRFIVGPNVNLSNVNLSNGDLTNMNLSGIDLSGADLSGTVLSGVSGQLSNVVNCKLSPSYMFANNYIVGPNVNLSYVDLSGFDLSGYSLVGANLTQVKGQLLSNPSALSDGYVMRNRYITGPNVNLLNADLSGMDLSGLNFSNTNFTNTNLTNTNLLNIIINNTITGPFDGTPSNIPTNYQFITNDLSQNYLIGPNVNLNGASLYGVDLTNLDLTDSDLSGVDLSGVNLTGVDLTGINFYGVKMGSIIGLPSNLDASYNIVINDSGLQFIIGPNVIIDDCDLTNADLSGCDLTNIKGEFYANIDPLLPNGFMLFTTKSNKKHIIGFSAAVNDINLSDIKLNNSSIVNIELPSSLNINTNSFVNTDLSGSSIKNNNIKYTMFIGSNFTNSNFTNTVFNRCVFINCVCSSNTNMSNVTMQNCYIKNTLFNITNGTITYIDSITI